MGVKPLGGRAFGSIGHLPNSQTGPGDHHVDPGQSEICQGDPRPGYQIWISEKLDGSCVALAKKEGEILPLVRAGYVANTSPRTQHRLFYEWARRGEQLTRVWAHLPEGWRIVGEWMAQLHGTAYAWDRPSPFVAFEVRDAANQRLPWTHARDLIALCGLEPVPTVAQGPMPAEEAFACIDRDHYKSLDPPEGVVYRVERNGAFCFLAKWVRPGFVPGRYLPVVTGGAPLWVDTSWARGEHGA